MNLPEIHRAIADAGFELGWTEVSVAGTVNRSADPTREGARLLRRGPSRQEIRLVAGDGEETRATLVEIGRWAGTDAVIRVRGRAHVHPDGSVAVEARQFDAAEAPD